MSSNGNIFWSVKFKHQSLLFFCLLKTVLKTNEINLNSSCAYINGNFVGLGLICRCGLPDAQRYFQVIISVLTFFLPLVGLLFFYSSIGCTVYRSEFNMSRRSTQRNINHAIRKQFNYVF